MNTTSLAEQGAAVNLPPVITAFGPNVCPCCRSSMTPSMEWIGGRGYVPHWNCVNVAGCDFSASEDYMILHAKETK